MMDELKPCPFCGRQPETWSPSPELAQQSGDFFLIQCDCGDDGLDVSLEAHSKEAAITAWNRRTPGWVSVADALPETGGYYLIYLNTRYGGVSHAHYYPEHNEWYDDSIGYVLDNSDVAHWMPLPPPPAK